MEKEKFAIATTSLSTYVNENAEPIIKNMILGAPSLNLLSKMLECKGNQAINIINTSVAFGDGTTCGWTDSSTSTLTQRTIESVALKVQMAFCQRALQQYWAGQEINVKAGIEVLPFEDKFCADVITSVSKKLEKLIWRGDSDNSNEFDGLWTIAAADAAEATPVVNVLTATAALDAALYTKLQEVIKLIPDEVYNDEVVVMAPATFRAVVQAYEAANPYHTLNFITDDKMGFIMPNCNVRVYGVPGMETTGGNSDMLAFNPKTAFYGCDYEDAATSYDFYFDKHNAEFEMQMLFNAGTQFAFLDEVVVAATYEA